MCVYIIQNRKQDRAMAIRLTDLENQASKKGLKVNLTKGYLANRLGNTVYLNENMLKYPVYCQKAMEHELSHTGKISVHDFIIDLTEGSIYDHLKFCFKHPAGFFQFSPIVYIDKKIAVDINLIIIYIIIAVLIKVFFL